MEGLEMFRKLMAKGAEEVYYKEAKRLLALNMGPVIIKEVLGEAQYLQYLNYGWELHSIESPSYGQLFKHRHMKINRHDLEQAVRAHEHRVAHA